MSHTCLSWFDYVTALDRVSSGSVVRASDQTTEGYGFQSHLRRGFFPIFYLMQKNESCSTPPLRIITSKDVGFIRIIIQTTSSPGLFAPSIFNGKALGTRQLVRTTLNMLSGKVYRLSDMGTQPSKQCNFVDLPLLQLQSSEVVIATACNDIFYGINSCQEP